MKNSITVFVRALNSTWKDVYDLSKSSKTDGLVDDWMQASWEALVENSVPQLGLKVRLVVYGDGADCHPRSSRFSNADDLPTHEIRCRPLKPLVYDYLSKETIPPQQRDYEFDRFVSIRNGWYFEEPPFTHALIRFDEKEFVADIDDFDWVLMLLCTTQEAP